MDGKKETSDVGKVREENAPRILKRSADLHVEVKQFYFEVFTPAYKVQ